MQIRFMRARKSNIHKQKSASREEKSLKSNSVKPANILSYNFDFI